MTFIGADTEQLDDLGRAMQDGRGRVDELAGNLSMRVRAVTTTAWHGADAVAFQERFHTVSQSLDELAERLQHTGSDVKDQAREQDDVSTSGAGLFEPGGSYTGQPWWQNAFDTGKGLWDFGQGVNKIVGDSSKLSQWARNAGQIEDLARTMPAFANRFHGELVDDIVRTVDDNPVAKYSGKLQGVTDWMGGTSSRFGESPLGRFTDGAIDILNSPALETVGRIAGPVISGYEIYDGISRLTDSDASVMDRISGGLSAVSGTTGLIAMFPPAAPIAGTISVATGLASAAIDAGTAVVENWDTISATTMDVVDGIGDTIGDVGDAIGDGLSSLF